MDLSEIIESFKMKLIRFFSSLQGFYSDLTPHTHGSKDSLADCPGISACRTQYLS